MTSAVHVATADLSLQAAARLMSENAVGALPVMDGQGQVIGLLSEADILLAAGDASRPTKSSHPWRPGSPRAGEAFTVAEAMSAPVVTITATAPIGEAAKLMRRRHVRHLPVVDADARLRGIVSRGDLLRVFLRSDRDITWQIVTEVLPRAPWGEGEPADVRVEAGVVWLRGELERRTEALLIERMAAGVEGVARVCSELTWKWSDLCPTAPDTGARRPA